MIAEFLPYLVLLLVTIAVAVTVGALRPYLEAKRAAATNEAQKLALDWILATVDDAVRIAVLATEQMFPKLPPAADGTPPDPKLVLERGAEKLDHATRLVLMNPDIKANVGSEGKQLRARIEAAVNLMKRGKL